MVGYGDITDIEVGLARGFNRDLQAVAAQGQAVVDRVAAERDAALREVARLRKLLATANAELEVARFQASRRALRG